MVNLIHPGHDLHIGESLLQHGPGHRSGCDAADGFPCGGPATARPGANAVFSVVCIVRVGGPVRSGHLVIGGRAVVLVPDTDGDRRSQGFAVQHSGKDFRAVFLPAGGYDVALPRPAPVQLPLNVFFRHRDEGRATINHHAYPSPMGFTPGRNSEHLTKTAGHGGILDGGVHPVKPCASAPGHKKHPCPQRTGVLKEKYSLEKELPS